MAKKEKTGIEILESAETLKQEFGKAENFLKKNQTLLVYVGGGILAIILGIVGYNYWTKSQNDEAQAAMFNSVYAFESDSLKQALNGTGGNEGLLKIADEFGATDAGNLANFYSGVALMKQGKFDEAIEHLKNFSSSDLLVQGRAYALIGDAYMEKKNTEEAITYYKKAADYKPNKFFTPTYLMKLATAYETIKDNKSALDAYNQILEKFPESTEVTNAKRYKSKLEGIVGE
ncbi:tetratricopeptide repeat protein [Emticicia sp. 17c]|uniref:tetratricopeptide repeat protein n=1 Tax=Emticicia sp. 17c TaxID=3127704 RepID=UPI00301BCD39